MNRRWFLKSLGMAAAGATVAYSFPSIIVPQNIEQAIIPAGTPLIEVAPAGILSSTGFVKVVGMRGLPFIASESGVFFGLSRRQTTQEMFEEFFERSAELYQRITERKD